MYQRCALRALFGLSFLLALFLLPGCGSDDPTRPGAVDDGSGSADFDGTVDPGAGEFVLQRITVFDPGQRSIAIDLIGSNLRLDAGDETVTLDVAVRNAWTEPLFPPLSVNVERIQPATVSVLNPDDVLIPIVEDPASVVYVFEYDILLPDGVLRPGETSGTKPWIFHDPGLGSFSFRAAARASLQPDGPVIGGRLFLDHDRDGVFDEGDDPFGGGFVHVRGPDGFEAGTLAGPDGRYALGVDRPGLYGVRFESMLDGPFEPCYTTPNPLQVLLTVDDDGNVVSFLDADFGMLLGPCPPGPLVRLTTVPPDSIPQDRYDLDRIELRGDTLFLRVGFSGCGPDHPFTLWAGSNFMESNPVQTWARLEHDDLGELCEAYWMRDLEFDLGPLRRAYVEQYGRPGVILVRFRDYFGVVHHFEFGP